MNELIKSKISFIQVLLEKIERGKSKILNKFLNKQQSEYSDLLRQFFNTDFVVYPSTLSIAWLLNTDKYPLFLDVILN